MQPVKDLMRTARKREAAGDLNGAVAIYEGVLSREPDHAGALHGIGVLMNRREEFSRAAEWLERAVAAGPNDPVRHVDLGESYRNLGQYRDAIGCCLTALKLRPDYPEGLNTLGLALQGLGDLNGAMEQFRRAHAIRPDFSPAHTNAGRVLQEIGAREEAVAHLRRAYELEPVSVLTTTNLGLALLECGQPMEALPHFREAVRLSPDLAVVHHNLGNVLRILGRTCEARESYHEAIRLDPKLTLSYLHIGITLRVEGALAEALRWYRIAAELEPDNLDIWKNLAGMYEERHEPDEALACLRKIGDPPSQHGPDAATPVDQWFREDDRSQESADSEPNGQPMQEIQDEAQFSSATILVGASPRESDTHDKASDVPAGLSALEAGPAQRQARRGLSLLARGQAAEALPHFQEAVRLRPDKGVLHHHLGHALRILGRTGEARASYLRALRLDPDLTLSFLHIGITLRLEGSLEDALKWHELAVEGEPDNPDFWDDLAELYLKLDQADKAVECRQRLLSLRPPARVDARLDLGAALEDDGRADEALEQYQIALQTHPLSPQVHFALSGIYEEWGDMSEAESEVRTAIRLQPRFPGAYARLATLLRGRLPEEDLEVIERLLAEPGLGAQPRARLLFALAHVLDARVRLSPRRGLLEGSQRDEPGAEASGGANLSPGGQRTVRGAADRGLLLGFLPANRRARAGDAAAGLHRRHAPIRYHPRRANPGQPSPDPRSG
jgi:tetratricopeptide (TPR) repeat protein